MSHIVTWAEGVKWSPSRDVLVFMVHLNYDEMEEFKWYKEVSVDSGGLHIPPRTA